MEKDFKNQNNNTVLCFFKKDITDVYDNHENMYRFDNDNFIFTKNNIKEIISIEDVEIKHFVSDFNSVIAKLRFYAPIILRWNSFGDDFELNLRKSANRIILIANFFKINKIDKCIVSTGVYHHLDTVILEIACRLCEVPRIYLYVNNITGRLIPMIQYGDMISRRTLNLNLSNYDSKNDLLNFKERAMKNDSPLIGGQFLNTDITIFYKAFFRSIYFYIRSVAANLITLFRFKHDRDHSFANYPFQFIKQIVNQYRALNYLKREIFTEDFIETGKPRVLILAHYQPEATSFPEGHDLWNHTDIVFKLKAIGYTNTIFYKEHFANNIYFTEFGASQVGSYRDVDYYVNLKKLNCVFIKDNVNSKYGGPNCEMFLPLTITGTVAVERSLNGLHTIVTGRPWYLGLPGVIHIDEINNFNPFNNDILIKNEEIAQAAFSFLNNMLTNKTIVNAFGIGVDGKFDKDKLNLFIDEFNYVINANVQNPVALTT